jgi:hypothetical protein
MRLGSGERFHTPTSPRLSVYPVSPTRRRFPPSIHRHHPQRGRLLRHERQHEPSITDDSVSPFHRFPGSSPPRFTGDNRNGTISPTPRAPPQPQHHQPPPTCRFPIPSSCPSPSGEGTQDRTSRLR